MAVDNYETVERQTVDELIERRDDSSCIITSAPIEHYSIAELVELAKKLERKDVVITLRAEYSNFYQGVLVGLVKRENVSEKYNQFL